MVPKVYNCGMGVGGWSLPRRSAVFIHCDELLLVVLSLVEWELGPFLCVNYVCSL